MASVTAEGFAKPFELGFQFYPQFGSQVPALRGFYLAYDLGDPSPGDHQINLIQVLAGDQSEDLSPNADLQPSNIPDGGFPLPCKTTSRKMRCFFTGSPTHSSVFQDLVASSLETSAALDSVFNIGFGPSGVGPWSDSDTRRLSSNVSRSGVRRAAVGSTMHGALACGR